MKINILYKISDHPLGGGNQFLKALKKQFLDMSVYEEDPSKADIILFNSHHQLNDILKLKYRYSEKIFVHRIDGPVGQYRGDNCNLDTLLYEFNNLVADATIFQSNWSKLENKNRGIRNNIECTIINAPDKGIFNTKDKINFDNDKKIRLIATSWSKNYNKGFDIYKYLDQKLDFSKYEMIFVGNSPIDFDNIKWIKPLDSFRLSKELKNSDIYITASKKDPCSNSLIEALHCGLPCVALKDGGHPEIIGVAGEFFEDEQDVLAKIDKVASNYKYYKDNIVVHDIDEVAKKYYVFFSDLHKNYNNGKLGTKKIDFSLFLKFLFKIFIFPIKCKIKNF